MLQFMVRELFILQEAGHTSYHFSVFPFLGKAKLSQNNYVSQELEFYYLSV